MSAVRKRRLVGLGGAILVVAVILVAAIHFPYDVDAPLTAQELEKSRKYYTEAYQQPVAAQEQAASEYETRYLQVARLAAEQTHVEDRVREFVDTFHLHNRPVLEIGSGRGYLQDIAEDYTGLDIASSVSRFYHKKFVLGSATAMPFADGTFDGSWSIWVLEHVPKPEQALREIRRVMRNNGVIFLLPTWNCDSWAADGYAVRPFSDFGLAGKLVKASIPIRASKPFRAAYRVPDRIVRNLASHFGGPTTLHYRRLTPNYKQYWVADSDAVNSIDRYEVMLWFRSRGDECLNCAGLAGSAFMRGTSLIIRVHK